jgi:hypothetical protein
MSKKSMILAAVAALAIVAVVAAVLVVSRKPPSPATSTTGATPSATSTVSPGTTAGTGTVPGQVVTPTTTTTNTASSGATNGGQNAPTSKIGPFPPLPDPKLPPVSPTAPAAPGSTLAPLIEAPKDTISALNTGLIPDNTKYLVVMRPYGIGPSTVMGSRLAIRVDKTDPKSKFISNVNLLVVADTAHGGTVTKGGTYNATITFVSDGTKLVPILSLAKVK